MDCSPIFSDNNYYVDISDFSIPLKIQSFNEVYEKKTKHLATLYCNYSTCGMHPKMEIALIPPLDGNGYLLPQVLWCILISRGT